MIQETIAKIRSKIENAESIKLENKAELLNLLAELKTEITKLVRDSSRGSHEHHGLR